MQVASSQVPGLGKKLKLVVVLAQLVTLFQMKVEVPNPTVSFHGEIPRNAIFVKSQDAVHRVVGFARHLNLLRGVHLPGSIEGFDQGVAKNGGRFGTPNFNN